MEYLHLEVSNSTIGGKSKRVTHLREDGNSRNIDIFYEFDRLMEWSPDSLLDGHVFAIFLYACSRGKPLKVHGALSRTALRNLEELQLVWCRWKPALYKRIEIIADHIDNKHMRRTQEKTLSAFSGGVDATFTALRHTKLLPENLRYPLSSVLMVHGFDVDLYNMSGFSQLKNRVKPLLDDIGLELRTIRTNSRELKLQDWNDSHGLELAACLHMYSDEFEFGLIGSSGPYDYFAMPWGSSPVADHLISGSKLSIIHDGAGFTRTDKVAEIIKFPVACQTIKVCWSGADQSGNCGKCEKCVRTQLNFLAAGAVSNPPCFPGKLDIKDILKIQLNTDSRLRDMNSVIAYAQAHNISGEWLSVLNSSLGTWNPPVAVNTKKKEGSLLKRAVAIILENTSFEAPTKKYWRQIRRSLLKVVG